MAVIQTSSTPPVFSAGSISQYEKSTTAHRDGSSFFVDYLTAGPIACLENMLQIAEGIDPADLECPVSGKSYAVIRGDGKEVVACPDTERHLSYHPHLIREDGRWRFSLELPEITELQHFWTTAGDWRVRQSKRRLCYPQRHSGSRLKGYKLTARDRISYRLPVLLAAKGYGRAAKLPRDRFARGRYHE